MKSNNALLLDIIHNRKKNIQIYVDELYKSLEDIDKSQMIRYNEDLSLKREELFFLEEIVDYLSYSGGQCLDCLNMFKKAFDKVTIGENAILNIRKYHIIKDLLKEYKTQYRKNYFSNKNLGVTGIFDNDLFCSVIKSRINQYTNCNKVTRKKYNHMVAFLTEFLNEMQNSSDPIKTLKHKMRLYEKYKKTEFIKIRTAKSTKIDIIKDIIKEYNKEKEKIRTYK